MSHLKIEISGGINSLTEIGAKICVQGYTQYEPVSVSHQRGARRRATGLVHVCDGDVKKKKSSNLTECQKDHASCFHTLLLDALGRKSLNLDASL